MEEHRKGEGREKRKGIGGTRFLVAFFFLLPSSGTAAMASALHYPQSAVSLSSPSLFLFLFQSKCGMLNVECGMRIDCDLICNPIHVLCDLFACLLGIKIFIFEPTKISSLQNPPTQKRITNPGFSAFLTIFLFLNSD